MERKAVSGIMLTLLLTSMLTLAFDIQPVESSPGCFELPPHFVKYADNPILEPTGAGFEATTVFNPAAIVENDTFYMLFRAQESWYGTSRIGLAYSEDGFHFERYPNNPVMVPEYDYEVKGGCEDPRIIKVNSTYCLTYTAYDGTTARLALATSRDLINWTKCGPIFPEWGWSKSGAIIPVKINGSYYMYFGDTNMWIAYSEDLIHWTPEAEPVLRPRHGRFDSYLVEPGPLPIMLEDGILLIYNGADGNLRYSTGWVVFSKDNPRRVIARADSPILEPTEQWEGRIVFSEALVEHNGTWYLYYGIMDELIGVATYTPTPPFTRIFNAGTWNGVTYHVTTVSNSTIEDFNFSQPNMEISLNVFGPSGTMGFCNVTIPKTLLNANATHPWKILLNGTDITTDTIITENGTHTFIYFTYNHSTLHVQIIGTWVIPEFPSAIMPLLPSALILLLLIIVTLVVVVLRKAIWTERGKEQPS